MLVGQRKNVGPTPKIRAIIFRRRRPCHNVAGRFNKLNRPTFENLHRGRYTGHIGTRQLANTLRRRLF
eukprot:11222752-Lingulodinium_polyedra.AAC.1